jgi:hypothetical protein
MQNITRNPNKFWLVDDVDSSEPHRMHGTRPDAALYAVTPVRGLQAMRAPFQFHVKETPDP